MSPYYRKLLAFNTSCIQLTYANLRWTLFLNGYQCTRNLLSMKNNTDFANQDSELETLKPHYICRGVLYLHSLVESETGELDGHTKHSIFCCGHVFHDPVHLWRECGNVPPHYVHHHRKCILHELQLIDTKHIFNEQHYTV